MQLKEIKPLLKDINLRLLFVNMILVLIGYGSKRVFGGGVFEAIQVVKNLVLLISIMVVLFSNSLSANRILNSKKMYFLIFAVIMGAILGENSFAPLKKVFTFVFPFLYIIYCVNYLLRYGAYKLLVALSLIIMLSYSIVPIYYLFFGADLSGSQIYGEIEGEAFVSNHYGWSSIIFLLSAVTVLKQLVFKKTYRNIIILFLFFSFFLLLVSATRSALLAFVLAFLFFIFKETHVAFYKKILLSTFSLFFIGFIATRENSVFDFIKQKSISQLDSGVEGRLDAFLVTIDYLETTPTKWLYGIGMFNSKVLEKGGAILKGYHNSYFEILFGVGIIVFVIFLAFMFFRPFKVFWKRTGQYSLLFFPLAIIPFFESDITAGQFLFFPWFAYMILLNSKELNTKYKPKLLK